MGKYHLPGGETLVEDLQCLVVYTPDDPVYRQALWGAISQLTKFWMWEPDGNGGEYDAADSWDLAYAATLESFGMLEQLLESVDEVEPLLRELLERDFCCDNLPGSDDVIAETEADAETSTTDVDGGVFPDGIANESEWDTYICNAATALIDRLIEAPGYITQFTSWSISLITAVALWYTGGAFIAIAGRILGVLTILDIFDLLDVFENLVAGIDAGTEDEPSAVESELLAIRDDLICDIVLANDADAAASAVNNRIGGTSISTVWKNLFLLFFTNEHFMATVFNGYADEAPGSTCDCQENVLFSEFTNFGTNNDGTGNWSLIGGGDVVEAERLKVNTDGLRRSNLLTGNIQSGDILRITITAESRGANGNSRIEVLYGGLTQETFLEPMNQGEGQVIHVAEHTFTSSPSDVDQLRVGNDYGSSDFSSAYDALIEHIRP